MSPFSVGDKVEVFSFGHWYAGEVVKMGRTRATIRYTTGSGCTRDKAFPFAKVRTIPLNWDAAAANV